MKNFYEKWNDEEISEYIDQFNVLILFEIHRIFNEVEVIVYGDFSNARKELLLLGVTSRFGGKKINSKICAEINEFAEKWYNKYVSKKTARVINFKKKQEKLI